MNRPLFALALLIALGFACKPRQQCPQGLPLPVQLLAAAGPDLNPCKNGAACSVNLRIFELKSGADLEDLDYDAIHERGGEVFGQNLVKPPIERALYPTDHRRWALELDPATTHVVTVALFGEPLGDAWYNVYAVPRDHSQRVCEAAERGKSLPDPCIFLAFDSYEVNGGPFPPAGFNVSAFEAECAPISDTSTTKKKRKRKRRSLPSGPPSLPPTDIPSAPSASSAPSAPSAPSASAPSLPSTAAPAPPRP